MNGILLTLAGLIWLVAAYAFARVAIAWFAVMKMAPSGQKFAAALDLGFWNFPAVQTRLGPTSAPLIDAFRRGFTLFTFAVGGFMFFVILNILTGNAA